MIALWMMYTAIVTASLAAAAALLDRAIEASIHQRRWIWVLALGLSAGIPAWTAIAPWVGLASAGRPGLQQVSRPRIPRRRSPALQRPPSPNWWRGPTLRR